MNWIFLTNYLFTNIYILQEFTEGLTVFTALSDRRQRDTISARQKERIVTFLNLVKKSVASLSISLQNALRYPHNPQAQVRLKLNSLIFNQTTAWNALKSLKNILQNQCLSIFVFFKKNKNQNKLIHVSWARHTWWTRFSHPLVRSSMLWRIEIRTMMIAPHTRQGLLSPALIW